MWGDSVTSTSKCEYDTYTPREETVCCLTKSRSVKERASYKSKCMSAARCGFCSGNNAAEREREQGCAKTQPIVVAALSPLLSCVSEDGDV